MSTVTISIKPMIEIATAAATAAATTAAAAASVSATEPSTYIEQESLAATTAAEDLKEKADQSQSQHVIPLHVHAISRTVAISVC